MEVEEGGQKSMHSIAYIVPLELDCEEADAVNQTDERDNTHEGAAEEAVPSNFPAAEVAAELLQSPIPSDTENGDKENEPAVEQPATESEGGSLQHSVTRQQSAQALSPELAVVDASSADTPNPETLQSSAPTRPQRAAAQRQRQQLQQFISNNLI